MILTRSACSSVDAGIDASVLRIRSACCRGDASMVRARASLRRLSRPLLRSQHFDLQDI